MSPHRIRLPAPWRATRSPAAGPVATTPDPRSSVIFCRSFQRPTGLTSQSAVSLEVTLLEPLSINVALNGSACPFARRGDLLVHVPLIPDQLQPVNELEITVQLPAPAGETAPEQPKLGQDYIAQVELVLA